MSKLIYIAGSITDDPDYYAKFSEADEALERSGYTALSPAWLPPEMDRSQYARIILSMIDSADAVLFLPDAEDSKGAQLEALYCDYIGKPVACRVEDLDPAIRNLYLTSQRSAVDVLENLKKGGRNNAGKKDT